LAFIFLILDRMISPLYARYGRFSRQIITKTTQFHRQGLQRISYNKTLNRSYHRSFAAVAPDKEKDELQVQVDAQQSSLEQKQDQLSRDSIQRLMEFSRSEWKWIGLSASTLGLTSSVTLLLPYASGSVIDYTITNSSDGYSPMVMATGLFALSAVAGGGVYLRNIWLARAGNRIVARLKQQLYSSILRQETAFLDQQTSTGDLISRLTADATLVQSAVTTQAVSALRGVIMSTGSAGMLLYTSPTLAAISCCTLPPVFIMTRQVGRRLAKQQKGIQELLGEATSMAEQSLNHISTVKQFVAQDFESNRYRNSIAAAHAKAVETAHMQAQLEAGAHIAGNAAILGVLGYGGTMVLDGTISAGDLTGFVMYSLILAGNLSGMTVIYSDLIRSSASSNRILEILDRTPKIEPANSLTLHEDINPLASIEYIPSYAHVKKKQSTIVSPASIDIQALNFAYPSRPDVQVMNNFNLNISPGETVALVGSSGSGKSTVANVLTRLYDTAEDDNSIRINGRSIREYDPHELRHMIGIVSQDPVLFRGTIRDNIRYGEWDNVTDEDILEAARQAHVLEFTDKFPDGLDTMVGPTQLSGGQRQRIALARVLAKKSPIIILDEATSALDARSEYLVQQALQELFASGGRTIISIAHRLSTIRHSSRIAVVENGSVVQTGTFETLQATEGPFRALMKTQLIVDASSKQ
jgi:ABC-type multidrug transport system fused ATPase/permease subunit